MLLDRAPSPAIRFALLVSVAHFSGACSSGGGDTKEERARIDRARQAFAAAYSAGDLDRTVALYTANGVLLPQFQPAMIGPPAIRTYLKKAFEQFTISLSLSPEEVVFVGDGFAYDWGRYSARTAAKAGGSVTEDVGKYLVLWRRQDDGSWKIERDIDNSSNPMHWNQR